MIIEKNQRYETIPLENLIDLVIGGDWGKDETFEDEEFSLAYCIRGAEFKNWQEDRGQTASIRKLKNRSIETRKLQYGDILLEISGGGPEQPVGRTVLIENQTLQRMSKLPIVCTNFLRLVRVTDSLNKKYINQYLEFFYKSGEVAKYQAGSNNLRNLKFNDYKLIEIPIAPLPEQKAIVAKIEQLFSELDNAVANLKTAKAKLKIYRQAVLKKAFEGELTKEWREKQTNLPTADELLEQIKKEREIHYKQQLEEWKQAVKDWEENGKNGKKPSRISKPKILDEVTKEEIDTYGKLPISWKWERFNNVTHKIGDIDHKMPKPSENGFPYLSTGNIYADGTMDFENAKTISEEDYKRLALKIKPEKNDIIFPRYGTIGRNILVNIDKKFLVSYSCAIIKNINEYINAKYAHYYSLSPVIKKEIKKYTVQTTQANIGIASIENFVFPLCSFEEQNQIVQEIESRLSVCDKIEETIETSLVKSEALRQSILKKAFEGKLLSEKELENIKNHPEYESAEELLIRIKKEREK